MTIKAIQTINGIDSEVKAANACVFNVNVYRQFFYLKKSKNKTRQYKTRQYKAVQGNTRQYKTVQGNTRQGKAR